jgi:hypothetical protein
MRQHRLIALLVGLAALLAVPAIGTTAPGDQVRGPACGDITLWDSTQAGPPAYGGTEGGAAVVDSLLTTAKPSCASAVYTISLYTDTSQTDLIASQTFNGDGVTSEFAWTYDFTSGAPHSVCVVATSTRSGHVIDAAPNSGCYPLIINFSGGGSGLN